MKEKEDTPTTNGEQIPCVSDTSRVQMDSKSLNQSDRYIQSFKILTKCQLQSNIYHFVVDAPMIARKIHSGQFIIVRPHKLSERIPLSICGWDREEGTINIVVMTIGKTSREINSMKEGDCFSDIVGPLGERTPLEGNGGTSVVVGGGYGTGAIIPIAAELKAVGNKVIAIAGARSIDQLILTDELRQVSDEIIIATNDGSMGLKGMVTEALAALIQMEKINNVYAVGPVPMMLAISELTRPFKIKTRVSLNAIMVDGTGMCGACRVTVGGKTRFACFHGPEFDGHQVDFEELMKRQKMFLREEQKAILKAG